MLEQAAGGCMTIVIRVNAPLGMEQAVKEALAMYCDRFGDCRVVEIRPDKVEQQTFWGVES